MHLAAHAKVHQLVREPHRALENAIMTFNVLEYCRAARAAARLLVDARGVRRRAPLRGVRRGGGRLRLHGEPVLRVEDHLARRSSTRYARCYGLDYLVFRFSNVYGRYDNDLRRMERVLPLFIHQLARGEPITVFGGDEKVLDFTYIDDCVDGIARGIERARRRPRRERDDQPRLRPGQHARARGGADRRRARRRAADQPWRRRSSARSRTTSPTSARRATCSTGSRRRRSTRASRARSLVPRVARRAPRGRPPVRAPTRRRRDRARLQAAGRRRRVAAVLALFGPTASRQVGRRRALARPARRRGRLGRLGRALRRAAGPDRGAATTRRGSSASCRSTEDVSVGEYQRLAHAAIDEIARGRTDAVVVGGTGLYLRAALVVARASAAARARRARALGGVYDGSAPRRRTRCSPSATRPPPRACTRTTAAASCARSSSPRPARRSRRPRTGSGPTTCATRRRSSALDARRRRARPADRGARRARGRATASSRRRTAAWAQPLSETARKVLGLEEFATLPARRGRRARSSPRRRRLARYQRKWLRRLPVAATLDADPPTGGDRR